MHFFRAGGSAKKKNSRINLSALRITQKPQCRRLCWVQVLVFFFKFEIWAVTQSVGRLAQLAYRVFIDTYHGSSERAGARMHVGAAAQQRAKKSIAKGNRG